MTAFYNENDPFAAQWLRNLISARHIAPGVVDERPIQEIDAFELSEFTQCHFFAGIGVWSHALRNAGWSDDRPIWTGSCPCQPFSNAGQKKGISDERHLWPFWQQLIAQRNPPIVVGEQVASKDGLGWLDLVSADMEASGYAFGASDLCAAGFDGAHIRQRLYFVGLQHAESDGRKQWRSQSGERGSVVRRGFSGLADDDNARLQRRKFGRDGSGKCTVGSSGMAGGMADVPSIGHRTNDVECEQWRRKCSTRPNDGEISVGKPTAHAPMLGRTAADWLYCRDGKWRPVEPGTFPLVDAAPSRVGRLRAYGNALDAQTATEFCRTVREICDGL